MLAEADPTGKRTCGSTEALSTSESGESAHYPRKPAAVASSKLMIDVDDDMMSSVPDEPPSQRRFASCSARFHMQADNAQGREGILQKFDTHEQWMLQPPSRLLQGGEIGEQASASKGKLEGSQGKVFSAKDGGCCSEEITAGPACDVEESKLARTGSEDPIDLVAPLRSNDADARTDRKV